MGQSKSKMLSPDAISVKKKGFLYYLKRDWQLLLLCKKIEKTLILK